MNINRVINKDWKVWNIRINRKINKIKLKIKLEREEGWRGVPYYQKKTKKKK